MKSYIKSLLKDNPFFNRLVMKPALKVYYFLEQIKIKIKYWKYNKFYFREFNIKKIKEMYSREDGTNIWFLLEQNHKNIGDLAIGVADKKIFEYILPECKKHFVYEYLYKKYKSFFKRHISNKDVIVLIGGGSIGNYMSHEKLREDIITRFKNNVVISMPQTMHFNNDFKGRHNYNLAVKKYRKNHNLYLLAREKYTYDKMVEAFPHNYVDLCPDAVMFLDVSKEQKKRNGIVFCFRNDMEKTITASDILSLKKICDNYDKEIIETDMFFDREFISLEDRENVVLNKINEFKSARLVLTDRLHCMIFCAISGTPCIAFSNYNNKILGCYNWIKDLTYIKFCDSLDEVESNVKELYNKENQQYSSEFTKPYWNKIIDFIEKN